MTASGTEPAPLAGIVVVELGYRIAASVCASLLSQLGATVVLVEPKTRRPDHKWGHRALIAAGKRSLVADFDDAAERKFLEDLLAKSDAVITSSDIDPPVLRGCSGELSADTIRCDITAYGFTGPCAGDPASEIELQALAGVTDTTGAPDHFPVMTRLPIVEVTSGIWGASAAVAALRVRRLSGMPQNIEVAMYDCAFSMLATFLPKYFAGQKSGRLGNRHPSIAPWNCYRTADGWVQICTGSADQWSRLADVIGYDHRADPRGFNTMPQRLARSDELDALIEAWTGKKSVTDAIELLAAAGIPCGPVLSIADLLSDTNLRYRNMVIDALDPETNVAVRVPGNIFARSFPSAGCPASIPAPGEGRAFCSVITRLEQGAVAAHHENMTTPLAGVRILEIGQWTTAPLAARLLAALGADVVKLEPPGGDAARVSAPIVEGQSYLFNLNNSDKRCVEIDMRSAEGRCQFEQLLARTDVLIENLKPQSLARLGYPFEKLSELNSRIIYCAISGFGADSLYSGRPAMDTVLQAMCGVMDLTRDNTVPYKIGVSVSDLMGGHFGLLAVLTALERERFGARRPQCIDLSMQDITAWATQFNWNDPECPPPETAIVRCSDGYVLAAGKALEETASPSQETKSALLARLKACGFEAWPIRSVAEVANSPQTRARNLITFSDAADGRSWPRLTVPFRLEKTPAAVNNTPKKIDDIAAIIREWCANRAESR